MDAESDALQALEERIVKAVSLVETLRKERDEAVAELKTNRKSAGEVEKLRHDVEELRAERKQVRARIEKLLAQVESL